MPVYSVLRRKGIGDLWAYPLLGAAIGLVSAALIFGIQASLSWSSAHEHAVALLRNSGRSIVLAGVYAAVAGAIFWLIAVRRGPSVSQ